MACYKVQPTEISSNYNVTKCEQSYTIENVYTYIDYLIPIMKEMSTYKPNIVNLVKTINTYKYEELNFDTPSKKQTKEINSDDFSKINEDNPFSYFASMYMLNRLSDVDIIDTTKQLEAVHDGWVICRLMTLNKDGMFNINNYQTNRKTDTIHVLDSNDKKESINYLINYRGSANIFDRIFVVKFEYKGYITHIRPNQLCMFLPFKELTNEIQNVDQPYLEEYMKIVNNVPMYKACTEVFKTKTVSGGNRESTFLKRCYKYIN